MADGYVKGQFDKGDLAGMFVVLIKTNTLEEAKAHAKIYSGEMCTVHEVVASHYDIDYNLHKILLYPSQKVD
jgi:hypothetical protein